MACNRGHRSGRRQGASRRQGGSLRATCHPSKPSRRKPIAKAERARVAARSPRLLCNRSGFVVDFGDARFEVPGVREGRELAHVAVLDDERVTAFDDEAGAARFLTASEQRRHRAVLPPSDQLPGPARRRGSQHAGPALPEYRYGRTASGDDARHPRDARRPGGCGFRPGGRRRRISGPPSAGNAPRRSSAPAWLRPPSRARRHRGA